MKPELVKVGLVKKTNFKPVGYFAQNPEKTYSELFQKTFSKLKKGKEIIHRLLTNSSGLSGELYLIQRDGGQKMLVNKQTRQTILDEFQLREFKKIIEIQLIEAERKKLKEWQLVGR